MGKNPKARKVMCVETGEIFSTMKEPQEKLGLKASGSITVALKTPWKTARGFHWVDESKFAELDTEEKRNAYLQNLSK